MPRFKPTFRLDTITEAATDAFARHGFRRTQMAHVAQSSQVSPGTMYLYVTSKNALFELALLRALGDPRLFDPGLPFAGSPRTVLVDRVTELLEEVAQFPELWIAAQRRQVINTPLEYGGITGELFEWAVRHRRTLALIDRCAADWPEVAHAMQRQVERPWVAHATEFLVDRSTRTQPGGIPEPSSAAAFLYESARRWASLTATQGWPEQDTRRAGQGVAALLGGKFLHA